ncbi:MAG: ribosome small subunit-dependent GTPase A [Prolixibacteraceae bacterium]|nr:ribosome small subunit-dependent GTPase A [Prolixibacteraceae bacterium]
MQLEDLGYNKEFEQVRNEQNLRDFLPGRVISEHKERYTVATENQVFDAEILGNLRFTAASRADFPAVGDWVALQAVDKDFAIIHKIFPRKSVIERQAVGKKGEVQIIAANVDYAFIIQAVDRDFNINRLQRYLAISASVSVEPVIILSKTDLISTEEKEKLLDQIKDRIKNVPVLSISNFSNSGFDELNAFFQRGKTYCFLGSSGVGKSTMINNLLGGDILETGEISAFSNKGKHVTTHRELIVLQNGAIVIDNPGMREVGMADVNSLDQVFDDILEFSGTCRYSDCTHVHESGCAVIEAVQSGLIHKASYENYLRLRKENEHFQSTLVEKKQKEKQFGKILKDYKKQKRKNDM